MKALVTVICLLMLAGCGGRVVAQEPAPPSRPDAASIENGRIIAERQCGACHAVGAAGESPRAGAPPLRTVLARFRADALAEDLNEGIRVGHPDMPRFEIPVRGVDDLIAYLQSLQPHAP